MYCIACNLDTLHQLSELVLLYPFYDCEGCTQFSLYLSMAILSHPWYIVRAMYESHQLTASCSSGTTIVFGNWLVWMFLCAF